MTRFFKLLQCPLALRGQFLPKAVQDQQVLSAPFSESPRAHFYQANESIPHPAICTDEVLAVLAIVQRRLGIIEDCAATARDEQIG